MIHETALPPSEVLREVLHGSVLGLQPLAQVRELRLRVLPRSRLLVASQAIPSRLSSPVFTRSNGGQEQQVAKRDVGEVHVDFRPLPLASKFCRAAFFSPALLCSLVCARRRGAAWGHARSQHAAQHPVRVLLRLLQGRVRAAHLGCAASPDRTRLFFAAAPSAMSVFHAEILLRTNM